MYEKNHKIRTVNSSMKTQVVLMKTEIRLITPSLQHVMAKRIEILVIVPKQQEDHLNY